MSDVLGNELSYYTHLTAIREQEGEQGLKRHLALRASSAYLKINCQPHNFNFRAAGSEGIGFSTTNLEALRSYAEEVLYTKFRADMYVPFEEDIPEGAETFAYEVTDETGIARFIEYGGRDAQTARIDVQKVPYNLYLGGEDAAWTRQDMRGAMMAGIPLSTKTIDAAMRACMRHIEIVALQGDPVSGGGGIAGFAITGDDAVEQRSLSTKFTADTADNIVEELQTEVDDMVIDTDEVIGGTIGYEDGAEFCILLPHTEESFVRNTAYGDNRDHSIWSYFEKNNKWYSMTGKMPILKPLIEGAGAGASSTDRGIFYVKDSRIMEMGMSLSPRPVAVIEERHQYVVPFEYRISALNLKRPFGVRYVDNV